MEETPDDVGHASWDETDEARSYSTYLEYNKVLRTWFVSFGVGGPAILLANDTLAIMLSQAEQLRTVVLLFLGGAACQVVGAVVNKAANWYIYLSTIEDAAYLSSARYKFANCLVEQFWIDVLLDVITIAFFGWAAWLLMTVFLNA
jgi:putative heme degradation protein